MEKKNPVHAILFVALFLASLTPWVTPPVALFAGIVFAFACRPVFPTFAKKTQKYLLGPSAIAVKRSDADLDFPRREVHDLELEVLEVAQAAGLLHQ
jgi:hypothetical protein